MAARSKPWTFVCDWGTDEQSGSGCSQGTFLNQASFALDITLGGQAGSKFKPLLSQIYALRGELAKAAFIRLMHVLCHAEH